MNSYFASSFLSPLQGENQASAASVPCNFSALPSRYEQQASQAYNFSVNQGTSGASPYTSGSPGHQHHGVHSPTDHVGATAISRTPPDLNGYASHGQLTSNGWNLATSQGHHGDYNHGSDPSYTPCTVSQPTVNNGQPLPFYPWMGIVGKCLYAFLFSALLSTKSVLRVTTSSQWSSRTNWVDVYVCITTP